jgi:hypothetical protein
MTWVVRKTRGGAPRSIAGGRADGTGLKAMKQMGALSACVYLLRAFTNQMGTQMGDVIRLFPKSELERIRLIREARAIYDSIFPPTDAVGERPDDCFSQRTQPDRKGVFPRKETVG